MKFKLGDRVRIKKGGTTEASSLRAGYMGTITSFTKTTWASQSLGSGYYFLDGVIDVWEKDLELINETKTFMSNIAEKIKMMTMGEPMKTFVKAGIATVDGTFTPEGKQAFFDFLVSKFGDDFKTAIVDKLVAEDSKLIG